MVCEQGCKLFCGHRTLDEGLDQGVLLLLAQGLVDGFQLGARPAG
ncbi:hypothetical protein SEA_ALVY_45 [Streptomyces phage Alvy]|uniref:Uncharacterized protein n=1 Tax=Streptomyces phage Alvy TaxID=2599888 RepID=A0A5J6TR92_9CAUD|nr:hypothetical protein KGG89_gp49 [Streptomyces phage Alvy]QFG12497.1 hypothetical protein SEA_ALVY_45 [Streptomyces phage Alvy]